MIFKFAENFIIDTGKEPFKSEGLRLGFYSAPGTRKSYTLAACVVEPFLDEGGTIVVFEPRSEWHTLKQRYGNVVVVGGPFQDIPLAVKHAKIYAEAIVSHGISTVFDFSDTEDRDLVAFAAELLARIFTLENVTRRPILFVVEEASEYAPFNTKGKMVEPWVYERMTSRILKFATQGRPLGVMLALNSQRPAQLNYTVRMMCNLSFYGKFHPKDLGDIEEVLSAYRERPREAGIKDLASQCVNMPHGQWLVITSEGFRQITVEAKRLTPHGADTPTLTTLASQTTEVYNTVQTISKTIQDLIQEEQVEESKVTKLQKEILNLNETIDKLKGEKDRLETALQVAGSLKITQPELSEEQVKTRVNQMVAEHVKALRIELDETIDQFLQSTGILQPTQQSVTQQNATQRDTTMYDVWAPKLPHAAKRILKLLAVDKKGLHMTKREIGVALGYRTTGGSFTGAIATLKRNHLIKSDGNTLWVE